MVFADIEADRFDHVSVGPSFLARLESNGAHDPLAALENFQRRID
jgi:hypothetical protein